MIKNGKWPGGGIEMPQQNVRVLAVLLPVYEVRTASTEGTNSVCDTRVRMFLCSSKSLPSTQPSGHRAQTLSL